MRARVLLWVVVAGLLTPPTLAGERKLPAAKEADSIRVEIRGTLHVSAGGVRTDLEDVKKQFQQFPPAPFDYSGAFIVSGDATLELYLGPDKQVIESAKGLDGRRVQVTGTLLRIPPARSGPNALPLPQPRDLVKVTGIKASDDR